MPLADYDAYVNALRTAQGADFVLSQSAAPTATRFFDMSRFFLPTPATPTASVVYNKSSDRAINSFVSNPSTGRLSILGARLNPANVGGVALMLVDILNISGGLDGSLTTAQTTNLPTAALTRYTSGEGVHAALIILTALGGTASTVTCSYTNQAGTAGRASTAVVIGGTGFNAAGALIRMPLQVGDTGVRSVESVTLSGTTGAVGNFGVVLYRPLAMVFANDIEGANVIDAVSSGRMAGHFAEVQDDACLSVFGAVMSAQSFHGVVLLQEV